jgi:hypothetical protein
MVQSLFSKRMGFLFLALGSRIIAAEKMSGQTTQLRGINTQYESIG